MTSELLKKPGLVLAVAGVAVLIGPLASLKRTIPHFLLRTVHAVTLPGGPAILTVFETTSAADPVTGRQYRLTVERFTFVRDSRVLVLSLSSPVGADNVDPWRIISQSLRFKS